jgi:hypothetical protein
VDLSRFPLESPGNGLNLPAEHDEGDGRADEDHAADEGGRKGFVEYEDTYKDGGERFHDAENGRQEPMRWTASTRVRLESTAVITASRAAIMNSHHEDRGWKVPVPTALANANAAPKNST